MFGLKRLLGSRTKVVPVLSPDALALKELLGRHGRDSMMDIPQISASLSTHPSRVKTLLLELTRANVVKSSEIQAGGQSWTVWRLR